MCCNDSQKKGAVRTPFRIIIVLRLLLCSAAAFFSRSFLFFRTAGFSGSSTAFLLCFRAAGCFFCIFFFYFCFFLFSFLFVFLFF
ncbi:hypothetical protein D1614_14750 [Maribellus luteus]|uniref:Uncharacterized protein n=1 Tax=Maribellus luteus TaxID=2305463 RepID=A0A399SXJ5_9BACT|nr:hypothetical protein D1614_14750 [Maribellus luteus]